jgi:hypothetical protein
VPICALINGFVSSVAGDLVSSLDLEHDSGRDGSLKITGSKIVFQALRYLRYKASDRSPNFRELFQAGIGYIY